MSRHWSQGVWYELFFHINIHGVFGSGIKGRWTRDECNYHTTICLDNRISFMISRVLYSSYALYPCLR